MSLNAACRVSPPEVALSATSYEPGAASAARSMLRDGPLPNDGSDPAGSDDESMCHAAAPLKPPRRATHRSLWTCAPAPARMVWRSVPIVKDGGNEKSLTFSA